MQLGLDVLPDGLAPPGTGGLPAPVAGLNFLALSHDEVRGTAPASYLGQHLGGEQL